MALNKVLLIGNVGKDPDVRHLEGGAAVASFSLATSERYKDKTGATKELTEWHNIVAWRQLADLAEKYIRKGTQIYVEGRLRSRSYTDQNGVERKIFEILADSIQLLGRRADNEIPTQGAYAPPVSSSDISRPEKPVSVEPQVSIQQYDEGSDDLPF